MKMRSSLLFTATLAAVALGLAADSLAEDLPDGTVHVRAFDLPLSGFLSAETQAVLRRQAKEREELNKVCPIKDFKDLVAIRQCLEKHYYPALIARHRARYPVTIQPETIAGVATEIITPAEGVSATNRQRVLINLHGGGFIAGGRWGGQAESIPIAAVGKFKVVAVDYRMAPEHRFPAASEDAAAVYRELLKTYEAKNIGLYGCSAGGVLTAQTVAWLQREGLPPPGAVGMFCGAGSYWGEGDSGHFTAALSGISLSMVTVPQENPYFKDVDSNDPLAFPMRSPQITAKFPPSLLIASTRDVALSSVAQMHSRLVAQGVEADLHVWEGLDHAFFFDPDLPESREVYDVTAKFFDRHLGKDSAAARTAAPSPTLEELLRPEIDRFVKADQESSPEPCQVLFVGSSSIVMWKTLANDMAPLPVINRGFGGSQIEYVNRWFDQVVAPYRPRAIVFYAGENDIAAGKSVERVVDDFDAFMTRKTAALGRTPVYFISLKPSKLRFWQLKQQAQVNEAIRARAKRRADLHYIDVVAPMLQDGKPKDLFGADNLHMAPQGYAIWTQAVKAALLPNTDAEAKKCRQTPRR